MFLSAMLISTIGKVNVVAQKKERKKKQKQLPYLHGDKKGINQTTKGICPDFTKLNSGTSFTSKYEAQRVETKLITVLVPGSVTWI